MTRVGYVSGVFDLLHLGHVRFLQACRERCDRLIVGVLADSWVEVYKRTPIIPTDQRVACVAALRVVDLAFASGPTRTLDRAFYQGHDISVQFVGQDHIDSKDFQVARELIRLEVVDSQCPVRTTDILRRIRQRSSDGNSGDSGGENGGDSGSENGGGSQ